MSIIVSLCLSGEEKSLRILARELTQLRELRDKEVSELISFNSQLQVPFTIISRYKYKLQFLSENLNSSNILCIII